MHTMLDLACLSTSWWSGYGRVDVGLVSKSLGVPSANRLYKVKRPRRMGLQFVSRNGQRGLTMARGVSKKTESLSLLVTT